MLLIVILIILLLEIVVFPEALLFFTENPVIDCFPLCMGAKMLKAKFVVSL